VIATLLKLAFSGIRSRLLASVLTIVLTGAAAATIVLTLEVGSTARDPWMRTFDAAHGAHVLAWVSSEAEARTVANLPGVAERDRPVPIATATMIVDGREVRVFLAGLDGRPRINAPVQIEGSGVGAGTIVLERSLAQALDIPVGTSLTFMTASGAIQLESVGTAVSPSQPRYPRSNPGLAWTTRATLEQVVPDRGRWRWLEAVRLTDPSSASAFAGTAYQRFPPGSVSLVSWQEQREEALREADPVRIILTVYALLLLIVSVAVVAILIGARVSGQYREIGILKAVGLTPRQVSAVFAIEAATLGLIGTVVGFVPGALLAPRLAAPSAATLLASPTVAANPWHILVAGVVILPVIVASAFVSARKSTRSTVLHAMRSGTLAPASGSRFGRAIAVSSLPIPMMLGMRDLLARRSRAIWLVFAIAVTGTAMVVTLSMQAALDARPRGEVSDVPAELPALVFTLDAVLAVITLSALVAVALLSVRERIRDFGVLRAIGLTPNQVASSLVGVHSAIALVASFISIPVGVGLYVAIYWLATGSSDTEVVFAPWWWLIAVPIAIPIATAAASSLPARLAAQIPAADAVRYE
jgi:ABC-type antimicrobial peptide transport system permease subunit